MTEEQDRDAEYDSTNGMQEPWVPDHRQLNEFNRAFDEAVDTSRKLHGDEAGAIFRLGYEIGYQDAVEESYPELRE